MLCLQEVEKKHVHKYGIVATDKKWDKTHERLHKIVDLVEKPKPEDAPSNLAIVGKYIIPKAIFDELHTIEEGHGGEIRLIDALIAKKNDIEMYGYAFEGTRLDTGTPEGYKEAVRVLG
jgi:UTP-glucose-1-phosphate uridylyltransferase